jgi:hypothetical protein
MALSSTEKDINDEEENDLKKNKKNSMNKN